MHKTTMTIGGEPICGTRTFGVINPATGNVFAEAPECSKSELDDAMDAAARAYCTWRADEEARREGLRRVAEAVMAAQGELAALLTAEQGKPLPGAAYEVEQAALWMRVSAELELPREVVQDDAAAYAEVVRRPLGVVAAITPWNYPLLLAAWKIGPALLAGNTVVLKPSPFTPLATLKLGEILTPLLPPGVVNVVSGGDELGAWMTSHSAVRKISFTGSVATGKAIAAAAAPDLKRVTLELGGNDAAIVLDDADPAAIARDMFWGRSSTAARSARASSAYMCRKRCTMIWSRPSPHAPGRYGSARGRVRASRSDRSTTVPSTSASRSSSTTRLRLVAGQWLAASRWTATVTSSSRPSSPA